MKKILAIVLVTACQSNPGVTPLPNAHSHNDYHRERPLFEALENGFTSVEADIHLVDGKLYVTHDHPETLEESKTLEALYLTPLTNHIHQNKGEVYPGYDGFFYLMIDVKTEAIPTYLKLKEVLKEYEKIISLVENGVGQKGRPVKIFISGNRAIDEILSDEPKLMALDGRPSDLGKNIATVDMPVVSQNYNYYLSWSGVGQVDGVERKKLHSFVENAHLENKKVRLWGTPDRKEVWQFLFDSGVDLINTDRLSDLKDFLIEYPTKK